MDSIDQIRSNISEIDIILNYARQNQTNIQNYQMFNKIAVVLLCTKFEVFLEEFVDEHSRSILQGHTNTSISTTMKENYVEVAVTNAAGVKNKTARNAYLQSLLTLLKNDGSSIAALTNIRPSTKFAYGKHGQAEIEKLFSRHGLETFIKSADAQNALMMMNSLFSIRNNVIHEDASPGLTHQTIEGHRDNIMHFVDLVENDVITNHFKYYNQ